MDLKTKYRKFFLSLMELKAVQSMLYDIGMYFRRLWTIPSICIY